MGSISEKRKLNTDEYRLIFSCIHKNYMKYCESWDCTRESIFNLKKKNICDIFNPKSMLDVNFERYIHSFRTDLYSLYLKIIMELDKEIKLSQGVKFIGRVKTEDSILNKIYKKSNEQKGKFPINNCLNDLLGLRIIDPFYNENMLYIKSELKLCIDNGYKIRHMDRLNKGYKAHHVYFKRNNFSFPIELQIWNEEDEISNLKLHGEYKQGYVHNIIGEYGKL